MPNTYLPAENSYFKEEQYQPYAIELKNQLAKDGIFIISMHQHKRSPDIWAAVDRHFDVMDKELVANGEHAWMVKSLKPTSK